MATTITFNDGSTSITIPTSDYPGQTQSFLDQSIQTAMGGRITSITRSAGEKKRWILNWRSLSQTDFNTLKTFIYTTVSGATTQFTYTDETSTNYTVKYTGGIENAQLVDFDSYAVEVNLAEIT
jgi:hypothetical protein